MLRAAAQGRPGNDPRRNRRWDRRDLQRADHRRRVRSGGGPRDRREGRSRRRDRGGGRGGGRGTLPPRRAAGARGPAATWTDARELVGFALVGIARRRRVRLRDAGHSADLKREPREGFPTRRSARRRRGAHRRARPDLPSILGVGYEAASNWLNGGGSLGEAALAFGAKDVGFVVALSSGVIGGTFAPSLFMGAALGSTIGHAMKLCVSGARDRAALLRARRDGRVLRRSSALSDRRRPHRRRGDGRLRADPSADARGRPGNHDFATDLSRSTSWSSSCSRKASARPRSAARPSFRPEGRGRDDPAVVAVRPGCR